MAVLSEVNNKADLILLVRCRNILARIFFSKLSNAKGKNFFSSSVLSILFIIRRGNVFGEGKCKAWLKCVCVCVSLCVCVRVREREREREREAQRDGKGVNREWYQEKGRERERERGGERDFLCTVNGLRLLFVPPSPSFSSPDSPSPLHVRTPCLKYFPLLELAEQSPSLFSVPGFSPTNIFSFIFWDQGDRETCHRCHHERRSHLGSPPGY